MNLRQNNWHPSLFRDQVKYIDKEAPGFVEGAKLCPNFELDPPRHKNNTHFASKINILNILA
jgi:hypothetical protein